jgi:predicted dehydrogenase
MTDRVRAAVVGVGHLGALHAAKYATTAGAELVGVYDLDGARAQSIAGTHGCRAFDSLDALLGEVDCVSVATPTATHREVAAAAIARGVHVLVEKPLAASLVDARELVRAADERGVLLFVGHLERFNPAFADLPSIVGHPRFIECHRLSPFAGRGADTDVVFDVMIHDLDLIAFVVGREVAGIEAIGVPVLSDHADIANARLRFEGGCIANVTASRVSLKRERRLRIFQEDAYVAVDFDARSLRIVRRKAGAGPIDPASPMDAIEVEERTFADDADPLREEIASFVRAVARQGTANAGRGADLTGITGREALVAVELAERVRIAVASEAGRTAAVEEGRTSTLGEGRTSTLGEGRTSTLEKGRK